MKVALLVAAFAAVPSIAFAVGEAECTAEWAQADANKDGVLLGPEADRCLACIRIRAQTSPWKGANSFTETQAKDGAVAAGVSEAQIAVHFKGNVVTQ